MALGCALSGGLMWISGASETAGLLLSMATGASSKLRKGDRSTLQPNIC